MLLNFLLSGTHDMFCYSQILWLAQGKVPHVLRASGFQTPACLIHTFPHPHSIQHTSGVFRPIFPRVVFFTGRWWVSMSLSKQPAADLVWGCMLVGKHGYTCGFFNLVLLLISGMQGMIDILVIVAIWC